MRKAFRTEAGGFELTRANTTEFNPSNSFKARTEVLLVTKFAGFGTNEARLWGGCG